MIDVTNLTIEAIQKGYAEKQFSVADIVAAYQKNIAEKNDQIHAYIDLFDDIDTQVARAQKMIDEGKAQPLTGIPFAMKDNILIEGKKASASSKILENYTATYDSDVAKNLKDQGAILLGRTNMDEFAMGSSTESSAYGPTKNPLDYERVPGGSSGGSAAAVAMDGAIVALGSDTGGSIRQPASFCGLVGLKPTYGSISRSGLMALASSLDIIGPMTKTVADAEIVFNTLSRFDSLDSTSIPDTIRDELKKESVEGMQDSAKTSPKKIGVPRDFLNMEGVSKEVLENFEQSLEVLRTAGYEVVDITLPTAQYALAVYYILMPAEASSNLSRYDGIRYGLSVKGEDLLDSYTKTRVQGFGKEVQRRVLLGTYVLSHGYYDAYYNKALALQKKIMMDFDEVFKTVDLVATPTTPTGAFKIGEKVKDPLEMYMSDIFTVPANIAGIPAISIPSGVDSHQMPIGLQLTAPYLREDTLFSAGKDFEKNST